MRTLALHTLGLHTARYMTSNIAPNTRNGRSAYAHVHSYERRPDAPIDPRRITTAPCRT